MATETVRPSRRARDTIQLNPSQRNRRTGAARWALAAGSPLNLDAATIIIASGSDDVWTTSRIMAFLWETVRDYSSKQHIDAPRVTAESLYTYIAYLHQSQQLATGSDSFTELAREIRDNGGLTANGRQQGRSEAPITGGKICQLRSDNGDPTAV